MSSKDGTTIRVCLAKGNVTNVVYQKSHPTGKPKETLDIALKFFQQHPIASLGIGSFGPIDLNPASPHFGHITSTPKLAWQDCDVVGHFKSLNVPINFNTDVNGAALAEVVWGEHQPSSSLPIRNLVYVTVGTGIGAGVVVDGQAVSGLLHPEAGHFRVPRHPDDLYKGNCFCESDTRVLTNHGFLFLDEIESLLARRAEVLYGCYELTKVVDGAVVESKELKYCAGTLVKPDQPPAYLVEFTEPGEVTRWANGSGPYGESTRPTKQTGKRNHSRCLSLRVTPDHLMYVQTGTSVSSDRTAWHEDETTGEAYRKLTAQSLLSPAGFDRIRMLACAESGYLPTSTARRDAVQLVLGMSSEQFAAFLELFGFWLGDGSMNYSFGRCTGVEFRQRKKADVGWLTMMLARAGLDKDKHDYDVDKHTNELRQFIIRRPDWCAFFDAEFGAKYCNGESRPAVAWELQTTVTAADEPTPEKKAVWAAAGIRWEKGLARRGPPVWFLCRAQDDQVGRECGVCAGPGRLLWAKNKALLNQKLRRHTKRAHPAAYIRPSLKGDEPMNDWSEEDEHREAASTCSTSSGRSSSVDLSSTSCTFTPRGRSISATSTESMADATGAIVLPPSAAVKSATCTFPACVLLCTATRNVTGALLLSAVQAPPLSGSPLPSTNQFYLQLTLVTSPLNAITVQAEKNAVDLTADEEDDDVVEDEEEEQEDDQPPVDADGAPVKSVKWLPEWVQAELSRDEMRLLIAGLHRADGEFGNKKGKQKTIYTSDVHFRDQLMQALLHCGYSATATNKYRKHAIRNYYLRAQPAVQIGVKKFNSLSATEQAQYRPFQARADLWEVRWATTSTVGGVRSSMPILSYRDEGVTRVPYSASDDGRTWCVSITHPDHLIIAQRAKRDESGLVTQQSRPVVVHNCPFHADCLEGLANAKACADRCDKKPSELHTVDDSHPAWDIEAFYLANLCMTLATIVSPHVIVLGGGVLKRGVLYAKTREQLVKLNNGYLRSERLMAGEVERYVVSSRFEKEGSGTSAGCVGVLELARRAYEEQSEKKKKQAML